MEIKFGVKMLQMNCVSDLIEQLFVFWGWLVARECLPQISLMYNFI